MLVAAISIAPLFPSAVTPAGASAEVFSGERALAATLAAAVVTAVIVSALAGAVPDLVGRQPRQYAEWPEVIPPNGEFLFVGLGLLAFVLR